MSLVTSHGCEHSPQAISWEQHGSGSRDLLSWEFHPLRDASGMYRLYHCLLIPEVWNMTSFVIFLKDLESICSVLFDCFFSFHISYSTVVSHVGYYWPTISFYILEISSLTPFVTPFLWLAKYLCLVWSVTLVDWGLIEVHYWIVW